MGDCAKVRELDRKRISDFRQRLHISFIRLHKNTGDPSANCRIFEPLRFYYFREVPRSSINCGRAYRPSANNRAPVAPRTHSTHVKTPFWCVTHFQQITML